MAKLQIKNLSKCYGNLKVLEDINITLNDGEFMVLVGPSGSGKSTILRTIAGLEEISTGELKINEKIINDLPPKDRDIAMVFQNYALYPHMSVYENLAFPLKMKNVDKNLIQNAVNEAAELLGLKNYLTKRPKELSGGERQRVALGRAIIRKPQLFLMDEPLSNLDAKLRTQMRSELLKLHKALSTTVIYVTHDQIEALTMGNKIVVLNQGKIQQIGTPQDVYNKPINTFVAGFVGSPAMNFFNFKITSESKVVFSGEVRELSLKNNPIKTFQQKNYFNKDLILGIRPEHILIKDNGNLTFTASIDLIEMLGNEHLIYANHTNKESKVCFSIRTSEAFKYNQNDKLTVSIDFNKAHYFDSETTKRIEL